jgi:hypothetical protein
MSRLTWEERDYHTGADRGALYFHNGEVTVWNGLITVTESPSDIFEKVRYRDGVRVLNRRAEDSFSATVECFTYPDAVLRARSVFDMTYRVRTMKGYQIHLVYNAMARFPGGEYKQIEPSTFTLDIATRPRPMPMSRAPSSHIVIDSATAYPPALAELERILYGDDIHEAKFPDPDSIASIFDINSLFHVVDNGDGTATISAPDEVFEWLNETQAIVDWPYVNGVDSDTVRIRNF